MKEVGILMPLSSLPSKTGIGELGTDTKKWLEILHSIGATIWQILPLNPVGYGNSPYQPYSSCAGDELYISLDSLYQKGLLKELPAPFCENEKKVNYESIRDYKTSFLRKAYQIFLNTGGLEQTEYQKFASEEWVYDYAVFRAMKTSNGEISWIDWTKEQKEWPEKRTSLLPELNEKVGYHIFLQYIFFQQWMEIKHFANKNGIRIMGDVPFYVGIDSADVWSKKENFLLDEDGRPIFIAGVPPDYFSATGQRWGNPIYDWEYLTEQKYQFWVNRIGYNSKLFDMIRIDHFRAFDTFWKIPAQCPTAVEGEWIEAPGYKVLDILKEKIPQVELIAEDLGDLRPEVIKMKNHYHLKGMKIIEFTINTSGKYVYDTFKDVENMVVYTGTHDNDTLMEWYHKLSCAAQRKVRHFLKYQGFKEGSIKKRLLSYALSSKAEYVILPMVDVLGLGAEAHFNTPGTVGSPNWEWRMPDMAQAESALQTLSHLIKKK